MTYNALEQHINLSDEEETVDLFWNEDVDGNHYTENGVVDNDCGETKKRNDDISERRDKYSAERKAGHDYYEKHSLWTYRSSEDRSKFLQEIEDAELCIKAEPRTPFEDKLEILFYKPEERLGRDPATREDPDIYYSSRDLNKCQKDELEKDGDL